MTLSGGDLFLDADGTSGGSVLGVTGDANINAGHLKLQGNDGYSAEISVGGTLTIGSGAHFDLLYPSAAPTAAMAVIGNINNAGTVTAAVATNFISNIVNTNQWIVGDGFSHPTELVMSYGGNFSQNSGTLMFNNNTDLTLYGGVFNFNGGSIQGTSFYNGDGSRPSGGGTITLVGGTLSTPLADGGGAAFNSINETHLTTDFAPNTSLYVFATATTGGADS